MGGGGRAARRRHGRRMYQHGRARLCLHERQLPPRPPTLPRTDASQMNATDVMLAGPATTHSQSITNETVPDAPPVPSFDYGRVVAALAGSGGTPYRLTIAAQLAA